MTDPIFNSKGHGVSRAGKAKPAVKKEAAKPVKLPRDSFTRAVAETTVVPVVEAITGGKVSAFSISIRSGDD
jgi:hypothetical protein